MLNIAIGGVSRAGKTTLANTLAYHFEAKGKKVKILHQDNFTFKESKIPKIRNRVDWEHPQSINFSKLEKTIQQYNDSQAIDVLISEGLLIFYELNLHRFFDVKILVEINKETFKLRKKKDDRWGNEPDWFIEHIWDSYQKYGRQHFSKDTDWVLSGERAFELEALYKNIER